MALVTLREVLAVAQNDNAAVGAFNVDTLEIVQSVLETIEEEGYPAIVAVGQMAIREGKLAPLAQTVRCCAKGMKVPIALHLDHGQSFEQVVQALRVGYTSVMIDGSKYPLQENIELTRLVVRAASAVGASVEAELGAILGAEDSIAHDDSKPFLVKVQDVLDFMDALSVDALAVGIGNQHGFYKGRPDFNFERLKEIRDVCSVPLVLHGGSGTPEDMVRTAISLGMRKVNVATEVRFAYMKGLMEAAPTGDYYKMAGMGKKYVKDVVREKISLFRLK